MPNAFSKPNGTNKNGSPKFKVDPSKFLYNVDTLYFSVDVDNFNEIMSDGFRDYLEGGRENAARYEQKISLGIDLHKYENPVGFDVEGFGKTVYTYQIRNNDYAIYFMREQLETSANFPIFVHINQYKLWTDGALSAYMETLEILSILGFIVKSAKPSRIDLCCHSDQFTWTVTDLRKFDLHHAMNHPSFEKLNPHSLAFETVMYGDRKRMQMRIYDKTKEIQAKNKQHFFEIYQKHDMNIENVWNIEFEVKRKYLKEMMLEGDEHFYDDMDNLLSEKGLNALWTHLTTEKFPHDSVFWNTMKQGDSKTFNQQNHWLSRYKDIDDSKKREIAQIRGRLQKLVMNIDCEVGSELNTAIKVLLEGIDDYEEEKDRDFVDDLYIKRSKFADKKMSQLLNKYAQLERISNKTDYQYLKNDFENRIDQTLHEAEQFLQSPSRSYISQDNICSFELIKENRQKKIAIPGQNNDNKTNI